LASFATTVKVNQRTCRRGVRRAVRLQLDQTDSGEMTEQKDETATTTTPIGYRKVVDTSETAWRHGFDGASLPLEHGRLLLGDDSETPTDNGEHIRLRQGKRSDTFVSGR